MVPWKKGPEKNSHLEKNPRVTNPRKKWFLGKKVPCKKIPGKMAPSKKGPRKNGPWKKIPG